MRSRLLLNLLLLAIATALATLIYKQQSSTSESTLAQYLSDDQITDIHIQSGDKPTHFVYQNPNWNITTPYKIRANHSRIDHLLKLLNARVIEHYISDQLALEPYGFYKAHNNKHHYISDLYISYNEQLVYFGKAHPINQHRYLLVKNHLLLVQEEIFPLLKAQTTSFINLGLLPETQEISQISSSYPKASIIDNKEQYDIPTTFFSDWLQAQAFAVHRYLPRKQLGRINIKTHKGDIHLEVNDDQPWLIIGNPLLGIEYHLDISYIEKLFGVKDA